MDYIYFEFDETEYWLEITQDKTALRQITHVLFPEEYWEISCIDDNLTDQTVEIDELVTFISPDDFEKIWKKQLAPHQKEFEKTISKFPIGSHFTGIIRKIYPQGVILSSNKIYAITAYNRLNRRTYNGLSAPSAGQPIQGIIDSYDWQNLWLVLKDVDYIPPNKQRITGL